MKLKVAALASIVLVAILFMFNSREQTTTPEVASSHSHDRHDHAAHHTATTPLPTGRKATRTPERGLVYDDFQLDPFPIKHETSSHKWADADGMQLAVIDQLVHNDLERNRVIEENHWTSSRELVYRKQGTYDFMKEALSQDSSGQKEMIIPGPNGREVTMVIVDDSEDYQDPTDLADGGVIYGHVKGDENSIVEIGFSETREVGFVIQGDEVWKYFAREDGQIVLSVINQAQREEYDLTHNGEAYLHGHSH